MSDTSKALDNFSKAHASSDKPAPATNDGKATKAEKSVSKTTSRAPDQATEREVKHRKSAADGDSDLHWAYVQGRTAKQSGIAKDQAPHADDSDEYKAWLKGWKFEDEA